MEFRTTAKKDKFIPKFEIIALVVSVKVGITWQQTSDGPLLWCRLMLQGSCTIKSSAICT